MRKKNAPGLLLVFFCCFSLPAFVPAQEAPGSSIVIPRERWSGFLTSWERLKQSFAELEERHRLLRSHYDPLPPKLERLEADLRNSEAASRELKERLEISGRKLAELTGSLRKQTDQTAGLERKVRWYRTAFFISVGAGTVATALLLILN
jgi:predicted RNase H-like nuclease (RuvC/YqgF family)